MKHDNWSFLGLSLAVRIKKNQITLHKNFMASRKLQTEEEVGSGSALSKWNRKKRRMVRLQRTSEMKSKTQLNYKEREKISKMNRDASKNGTFKRKLL